MIPQLAPAVVLVEQGGREGREEEKEGRERRGEKSRYELGGDGREKTREGKKKEGKEEEEVGGDRRK